MEQVHISGGNFNVDFDNVILGMFFSKQLSSYTKLYKYANYTFIFLQFGHFLSC